MEKYVYWWELDAQKAGVRGRDVAGGVGIWLGHRWGFQGHVKKGARKNRNSEDL